MCSAVWDCRPIFFGLMKKGEQPLLKTKQSFTGPVRDLHVHQAPLAPPSRERVVVHVLAKVRPILRRWEGVTVYTLVFQSKGS